MVACSTLGEPARIEGSANPGWSRGTARSSVPIPALDPLLPVDRLVDVKPHQTDRRHPRRELAHSLYFPHPTHEPIGRADIKSPVAAGGKDVE